MLLAAVVPMMVATSSPARAGTAASTSTAAVAALPEPGQSTSYQMDATHSGRLEGGVEPPLDKRWTRDLGGIVTYPLVAEGKVFALAATSPTLGVTLFALDASTGEDVWGPLDMGSDAWFAYGDGQVFVLNEDGVRRSIDAATGALRWIDRSDDGTHIDSPPVYADGVLWHHAHGNRGGLVKISGADGRQLAKVPVNVDGDAAPAVSPDLAYTSHECSPTQAFDVGTGAPVWSHGTGCGSSDTSYTPVVAEGMVWARGLANQPPTAIDAVTGAEVTRFTADATPAFDGGRGYFLNGGALEARVPRTQAPLWSFAADGQLKVAPIVVNGHVYVASASGQIWALDGETGEVVWTGDAGAPVLPPGETDDLPQLIGLAAGQGVVVVPATNLLVAFGAQGGGTPQASAATAGYRPPVTPRAAALPAAGTPVPDEATSLRIDPAHRSRLSSGRESAPLSQRWTRDLGWAVQYSLLAEGKVFAVAGQHLFAIDAETGADAWPPIVLSPVSTYQKPQVTYGDGRLFAAGRSQPLRAFDAGTGSELWSTAFKAGDVLETPPVYSQGLVFTVSHVSGLRAVSAATGREVWSDCQGSSLTQIPSIDGGTIYSGGSEGAGALDALSAIPLWSGGFRCGRNISVGSAVAHGRVWTEGTGQTTPMIFDTTTGRLVGAFGGSLPAFDDGRYYVRQGPALKGKGATTHFTEWTFLGDGQLATNPVVIDGLVFVGSVSGRLWALDPSSGTPVWEGDAGVPMVDRSYHLPTDMGTNIAAGQGLVVVPATNQLVAFEPVTPPPPLATPRPRAWGWNALGQLGDGSTADRLSPVTMVGLTDVVQVAAGAYHDMAVRADGTVWAVGWNDLGQLGDGTTAFRSTPVQVKGLTDVVAVTAGAYHSMALKRDGTVWAWGWNGLGLVGDGTDIHRLTPVKVSLLTDIVQVAAGLVHTVAVKKDGSVWSWGWNGLGQLGDGGTVDQRTPVRARELTGVVSVGAGGYHSLAVKQDGTVVSWGWNNLGQLGDGTIADHRAPRPVPGLAHVARVTGGLYHSLALHDDGTVSAWGWNALGQLGDGTTTDRRLPVKVPGLRGMTDVAAGFYTSLARRDDGRVVGWGWNGLGQLGNGTTSGGPTPQTVPSVFGVETLASGAYSSLAA